MIFEKYSDKDIEKIIFDINKFLKKGYDKDYIFRGLKDFKINNSDFFELFEIARARIKGKEKFKDSDKMFFSLEDLRFSTPEIVADYRAKRLKCPVIVDLCSGIGSQAIAFSRICDKVYSIEIDKRKVEYAKRNAAVFDVDNVEFICGDVLDDGIVDKIEKIKPNIIFCDPERMASESERRIENLTIVKNIIERYSKICPQICIEVPPQISPDKINLDCEKEYVSIDGELNRLDLYFGRLMKNEVSVVSLPSCEKLASSADKLKFVEKENAFKFIYDVDRAVLKAGLIDELGFVLGSGFFIFKRLKKNLFLTSNKKIDNKFLQCFEVVASVKNDNKIIVDYLNRLNSREVVLRGEIPESSYWGLRKSFENKLNGTERFYLFLFDFNALICRKI